MFPPPSPAGDAAAPPSDELHTLAGRLIASTGAAMALADLQGRITFVNPAFLSLWGFASRAEVLGRRATDDFWMEPERARAVVAALEKHGLWQGELMARTRAGVPRPMRLTAQMLFDRHGRAEAMLGTFVDISSEVASRVAHESQRQLTDWVVESVGALIVVLDEEGRIVSFNGECERVSGWRAEEVLGRFPWDTVLPPEAAAMVRQQAFEAAMREPDPGRTTKYTNEWISRAGARRLIEWTNRVLLDPALQRRVMVCIGIDVSARHEAEQAVARSEAQLRAAQAVAQVGSWELDLATGRIEWSDEVFRLFEIEMERFEASYAAFLEAVHPDDRAAVDSTYKRSVASREPYRIEHRLLMRDGRIKWVEERGETECGTDGTALRSRGTVQDISERHAREVELQQFRHLVEQAPMEIWLTDETYKVVYVNRAGASSLGMTQAQLLGVHLADLDPGGEAAVREVDAVVDSHRFTEGAPQVFRRHHRAADGRIIPKELYATVRDIDGRRHGISFARDITEQLLAQQALADSEALMRVTLDTYPGWVACVERDMRYVYVNGKFAKLVGLPVDRIVGRTADDVLGEQGREERRAFHRRLLAGEVRIGTERRFTDLSGRERILWVEYRRASGLASERGDLFFAFSTDVTDLRRTQWRLAAVTQDMGIGLWEWHHPDGALDFNDELLALVGYSRGDVTSDPLDWLNACIHPDDGEARRKVIADLFQGRLPRAQVRMRVRHRQGHFVWVQEALRIVDRDDATGSVRLIGLAQDIGELKAREAELEALMQQLELRIAQRTQALVEARREAERANAAKSEFLSQMSHELRTPLNAIIGFGQLLELSTLPAEDAEHVQQVMRAGRHLLQLIDEVLDLASVEAGRARMRMACVSMPALVDECVRLLRPVAQAADVVIEFGDLPEDAVVHADAGRLKQVLLNLLSNAVKYNQRGGRVLVSVVACTGEPVGWALRVADTGAGLTADQIGRLFQPFERLNAARSGIAGTGIGLALSRRLVDLMGGTLNVESTPGQGSTFVVRLPQAESQTSAKDENPAPRAGGVALARTATVERRCVLYVEDNEANQRLMARMLAKRGNIDLRTVSTAREALASASTLRPELLLIDIQLPDGDGNALLNDLRARGVTAPAVAVSANAMPADVERGRDAGFVDYLTKPVDLAQVLTVLDAHLMGGPPR